MRPYYIFDKSKLVHNISVFKKNFKVYYPCKVNSFSEVIKTVDEMECGFEADSIFTITKLVREFDINPDKILYNGLVRSKEDIQEALELGIKFFAVDNMNSLKQIQSLGYVGLYFLIRISINSLTDSTLNSLEKWGATLSDAMILADYITSSNESTLKGFSFYFPKEFKTLKHIQSSIEKITGLAEKYTNITIDIGGGIDINEIEDIVSILPEHYDYIIEPGRHLVGNCFDLVCNIIDFKENNEKILVFLDVGIYSGLIDVIVKGYSFSVEALDNDYGEKVLCHLCGCTSDISDCLGQYWLPINTIRQKGKLVINNCGAYCPQMHMDFAERPKCKVENNEHLSNLSGEVEL